MCFNRPNPTVQTRKWAVGVGLFRRIGWNRQGWRGKYGFSVGFGWATVKSLKTEPDRNKEKWRRFAWGGSVFSEVEVVFETEQHFPSFLHCGCPSRAQPTPPRLLLPSFLAPSTSMFMLHLWSLDAGMSPSCSRNAIQVCENGNSPISFLIIYWKMKISLLAVIALIILLNLCSVVFVINSIVCWFLIILL